MVSEIYYVTGNQGKFYDVEQFLLSQDLGISIKQQKQDLEEVQSSDMLAIALYKARQAWDQLQKPIMVDDSGIYFDKYHKFPGTLTKFLYKGIGLDGICKLINQGDRARFVVHVVYMKTPEEYHLFEGICEGHLIIPSSFGYDPELPYRMLFVPNGSDKTYYDLRLTPEYHKYSARLRALTKFADWYRSTMAY